MLHKRYPQYEAVLNPMNALASLFRSRDAWKEVTDLYRETLTIGSDPRGPGNAFTLGVCVNLPTCWLQAGQLQRENAADPQAL